MVLSPHAVPVVSSLWIRGWRDAAPQRARFRFLGRWSPPVVRGEGGPLFHWTCRKCRSSSSSIVTTRAPENTRSSNDGDGSGEGGGGSNGTEDLPHLGFFSSSLSFAQILALALSSSLQPLHRVSRSTFLRCVHVGDTTTLSGRSGSLQRAPSESIPPISPPPSSSSISDQQGL